MHITHKSSLSSLQLKYTVSERKLTHCTPLLRNTHDPPPTPPPPPPSPTRQFFEMMACFNVTRQFGLCFAYQPERTAPFCRSWHDNLLMLPFEWKWTLILEDGSCYEWIFLYMVSSIWRTYSGSNLGCTAWRIVSR